MAKVAAEFACPHRVAGRICWRCQAASEGWRSTLRTWWLLNWRTVDFHARCAQAGLLLVMVLGVWPFRAPVGVMIAAAASIVIGVIRSYEAERRRRG